MVWLLAAIEKEIKPINQKDFYNEKLFPIFIFAITMSGFVHSTDMRNVNWGMSIEEVKAAESVKPELEKENMLGFIDELNDKQIFILYYLLKTN